MNGNVASTGVLQLTGSGERKQMGLLWCSRSEPAVLLSPVVIMGDCAARLLSRNVM